MKTRPATVPHAMALGTTPLPGRQRSVSASADTAPPATISKSFRNVRPLQTAFASTGLVSKRRRADVRFNVDSDAESPGTHEADTSHVPNSAANAGNHTLPLRDVFEAAQANSHVRSNVMPDTPMKPSASCGARASMHRRGVSMGSTTVSKAPLFSAPGPSSPIYISQNSSARPRPEALKLTSFTHDAPRRHMRSVSELSAADVGLPLSSTPVPSGLKPGPLLPTSPESPESPLVSVFRDQNGTTGARKTFYPTATAAQASRLKSSKPTVQMDSPGNCFASPKRNPPITLTMADTSDEASPAAAKSSLSFKSQPMARTKPKPSLSDIPRESTPQNTISACPENESHVSPGLLCDNRTVGGHPLTPQGHSVKWFEVVGMTPPSPSHRARNNKTCPRLSEPVVPVHTPHIDPERSADVVLQRRENQFERSYVLEGVLGRGEFSQVMRVRNRETGVVSAVKCMNHPFLGPKDRLRRLEEVDVLRLLLSNRDTCRDPFFGAAAVIDFMGAWEENRVLYIQTELCPLGSLASVLTEYGRQVGPLDEARLWKILAELGGGIDYIHKCNVLHLDLKPDNVLITEIGSLKISDFGMATRWPRASANEILEGAGLDTLDLIPQRRDSEASDMSVSSPSSSPVPSEMQREDRRRSVRSWHITPALEREGDREYLAPEVMFESKYGRPADMFSLGLIVLEAACSVEIPDNGEPWQKLRSDDFSDVNMDSLSPAMQNIITSLLCSKPELRLTASELVEMPALAVVRSQMLQGLRASELDQLPVFNAQSNTRYPLPATKYYEPPMFSDEEDRRVVKVRGSLIQEDESTFLADVLAAAGTRSAHASSPDTSMSLLTDEMPTTTDDTAETPLLLWYGDRPDAHGHLPVAKHHDVGITRGTISVNELDDEEMFWS